MKFDLSHIYVELKDETPIALVIRTLPILVAFLNSSSWILVDIVVKLDMVYKKICLLHLSWPFVFRKQP